MTKETILKKAIQKAVKNGFDVFDDKGFYFQTIFSHDFAKAFFPESKYTDELNVIAWKYHLRKMVLKKDPLKYLERFL